MEDMDMLKNIKRLLKDEEAPTAVEYALMVAGVAVLIIVAVWFLGGSVSNKFSQVGSSIAAK
jgi:pilus assembly protein Flp/PilA